MSRKLPKRKPGQGWAVPARDRTPKERHDGTWWWSAPWSTREASQAPDAAWCQRHETQWPGGEGARGKVRCPTCGRRLTLMQVDAEHGYGDFWPYLPPHKVPPAKQPRVRAAAAAAPPEPEPSAEPPRGFRPRPPVTRRLSPKERRAERRRRHE